ncbi:hypothetical protein PDK32_18860 [Bacillus cereus]|nr:hypothetical protein [Bacillus cereus]
MIAGVKKFSNKEVFVLEVEPENRLISCLICFLEDKKDRRINN